MARQKKRKNEKPTFMSHTPGKRVYDIKVGFSRFLFSLSADYADLRRFLSVNPRNLRIAFSNRPFGLRPGVAPWEIRVPLVHERTYPGLRGGCFERLIDAICFSRPVQTPCPVLLYGVLHKTGQNTRKYAKPIFMSCTRRLGRISLPLQIQRHCGICH